MAIRDMEKLLSSFDERLRLLERRRSGGSGIPGVSWDGGELEVDGSLAVDGNISASGRVLLDPEDVSRPLYSTPNSGSDYRGYWAIVAEMTVDSRYGDAGGNFMLTPRNYGTADRRTAIISIRSKQQNDFGGNPVVSAQLMPDSFLSSTDIRVVVISNTAPSVVRVYVRMISRHIIYLIKPLSQYGAIRWQPSELNVLLANPPSGVASFDGELGQTKFTSIQVSNWNNAREPGMYWSPQAAANTPPDTLYNVQGFVFGQPNSDTGITQMVMEATLDWSRRGNIHSRYLSGDGTTWSDWKTVTANNPQSGLQPWSTTLAPNTSISMRVDFPEPFDATPSAVIVTPSASARNTMRALTVNSTGFTCEARNNSNGNSTNLQFWWAAFP